MLLIGILVTGLVGVAAVGARVSTHVEGEDNSLITARSQAEFIASKPASGSYPVYPFAASGLVVTSDVSTSGDSLQLLNIQVSNSANQTTTLETCKALRFVTPGLVPEASGLERVKTADVPTITPAQGFAVVLSDVFTGSAPNRILVEWTLTSGTSGESRTVAVYKGRPFGTQTGNITTSPTGTATVDLLAIGTLSSRSLLSVVSRNVFTGDHTVYLYNESAGADVVTASVEIGCVCEFAPISAQTTAPTITSVSPNFGPTTGGTSVTIAGTRYVSGATVTFGGTSATGVTVVSSSTITATTAAHASGAVNVVVTNPNTETGTLAEGFSYLAPPSITSLSPTSGPHHRGHRHHHHGRQLRLRGYRRIWRHSRHRYNGGKLHQYHRDHSGSRRGGGGRGRHQPRLPDGYTLGRLHLQRIPHRHIGGTSQRSRCREYRRHHNRR